MSDHKACVEANNEMSKAARSEIECSGPFKIRIETENQIRMFTKISQVIGWCEKVYHTLTSGKKPEISYRRWVKIVSRFYIDVYNFHSAVDRKQIHTDLIAQTSLKLDCEIPVVEEVFEEAKLQTYPLISRSSLTKHIPRCVIDKLILQAGERAFTNLVLRYHVLSLSEGMFLSMDPEIYRMLVMSATFSVLECFASPFNNNSFDDFAEYCSLFDEDVDYGAFPSFNVFIDAVDYPLRLIVNPPYTPKSIEVCIDKIISYMERVGGAGEFIALLPELHYYEHTQKLLEYKNTCYCLMKEGEHCMFDYFSGKYVLTPTNLYLIVNIQMSAGRSKSMLDSIRKMMLERAKSL